MFMEETPQDPSQLKSEKKPEEVEQTPAISQQNQEIPDPVTTSLPQQNQQPQEPAQLAQISEPQETQQPITSDSPNPEPVVQEQQSSEQVPSPPEIREIEKPVEKPRLQPPTRGIPAKESMWLQDVRKLRDEWKYHQNVRLELTQLMHLIFPEKYQAKYYQIGLNFMQFLLKKGQLYGDDIGEFLKNQQYSKATFYNVILPRLKRVGMVKTERETFSPFKSKQKFHKKIVKPSTEFSLFFSSVAREYESIVNTARARASEVNK